MCRSLYVISFVDLVFTIEYVAKDHKVELSTQMLIFHFVETVNAHKISLRVTTDILSIGLNQSSEFEVLLAS